MEAIIREHIRLGTHLDKWKTARGVTIPKPGKDDYSLAKVLPLLTALARWLRR